MDRTGIIMWGLDTPISGRSDIVMSQRRCLVYLCSKAGSMPGTWNYLEATGNVQTMAHDLGLSERVIRRSLKRLQDEKLIFLIRTSRGGAGGGRHYRLYPKIRL